MSEQIANAVVTALADRVGLEPEAIDLDAPLAAIPGIDSILLLSALVEIEEACGMPIPDEVLFNSESVRDLIDVISTLREQPA